MRRFLATSFLLISNTSAAFPRYANRIIHAAKSQIQRKPALTHGVVGFVLFGASDAFAQQIEVAKEKAGKSKGSPLSLVPFSLDSVDMIRFLSAGVIGAFFGGFVYPFAYKYLDKIWKGTDVLTIAKKSIVEVFTVGVFANSVSMAARGLLVGKDPLQVMVHVKDEMPEVTLTDLRVWFPYNMIAFGLIPVYIRPATTLIMECLWQTYISLRSNDYEEECKATLMM